MSDEEELRRFGEAQLEALGLGEEPVIDDNGMIHSESI